MFSKIIDWNVLENHYFQFKETAKIKFKFYLIIKNKSQTASVNILEQYILGLETDQYYSPVNY